MVYVSDMFLRRKSIEGEQAIVRLAAPGDNPPWRSQLYFIAMITKHLLANGEIRYLQQRTLTKQKICTRYLFISVLDNERQEKHDAA